MDENDEPTLILVDALVDNNEPEGTTYRQSSPQIGGAYWMSLKFVETPVSGVKAPLECYPLSVVKIDECSSSLDFVLIVEKNDKFPSRSPAMNSENCLASVQLTQHNPSSNVTFTTGFVNNYCKWVEVFASLFDNCHFLRLLSTLLLKKRERCNRLSTSDFCTLTCNNEPICVLSYNEKTIVTVPQVFIQMSKADGLFHYSRVPGTFVHDYLRKFTDEIINTWITDSTLVQTNDRDSVNLLLKLVVTVIIENGQNAKFTVTRFYTIASFDCVFAIISFGASLIPEMEKQCEKECSKTHMLDSTQGHLILLALEPVHLRAASPWALWIRLLALPGDKNGFFIVFSSQFRNSILLQENLYSPTTCNQMVSLRNFNCAALPSALWSAQNCKEIYQLQTHSTIIITILLGAMSESLNSQIEAICQPRSTFCIDEVIDFLQINSKFSSSRYTYGPVVSMTTAATQSVVHLICHAWLLLIHAHKHNISMSTSFLTLPYFALGTTSHVFESLSAIFVNKSNYKKAAPDVIGRAVIFYVAYVLFLHMLTVEKLMPYQIVEFPGHYMTKKEIATFWIWLPTTLLRLQVWVLNLHGLIGIKAKMLIGDAFLKRELLFDNECHIIPTGAIVIRRVCHSGGDLHITSSYPHTDHFNMCWLQTNVILLETTYTWAYLQVAFDYGLTIVLRNINEDFHMVYSTLWVLSLFNCDIPHVVVWSSYCRLDYISEQDLMIVEDGIMHSAFTVIGQSTTEQPKIDEYMVPNFEGALSTWGCSKHKNETKIMLTVLQVAYIVDGKVFIPTERRNDGNLGSDPIRQNANFRNVAVDATTQSGRRPTPPPLHQNDSDVLMGFADARYLSDPHKGRSQTG